MATWMSTPTSRVAHLVNPDGEPACGCPLGPARTANTDDALLRCRRCTNIAAGAVQSADVVSDTGATYRQIDYWERRGYIHADPRPKGSTSGTPRTWAAEELRVAREMALLVSVGVLPEAAHRAARHGGVLVPGVRIVIEAGQVAARTAPNALDGAV